VTIIPAEAPPSAASIPLCVDLDGTLVLSDLLCESFILLIKRKPWCLLLIPFWLFLGRAYVKGAIAARVELNVQRLAYHGEFVEWLKSERLAGRCIWLCTAADESLAINVARHLGLFDGVLASDRSVNLSGVNKAARLVEKFGDRGFDYCGNEYRDIEVWKRSRGAIVVGDQKLLREAERHTAVLNSFMCPRFFMLRAVIAALRVRQ